ncbi:MAG: DUF92 domain-containing protein [Ardenticatenales bacterium]
MSPLAISPLAIDLGIGALLAAAAAFSAYRLAHLTVGGAVGATVIGAIVFGLGGWEWALLLLLFFASSSAITRWRADDKADAGRAFAKGGRRDLGQVLANGGLPALVAIAHWRFPDAFPNANAFAAYAGALAVATGDTWATEVGLLSEAPPRLVTTGRIVRPGTSGAVTVLGTVAAVVGAATIGLAAAVLFSLRDVVTFGGLGLFDAGGLPLLPITALAGLAGATIDSLLGATVQGVYRPRHELDAGQGAETERSVGPDGVPLERVRGWRFMTNDTVNALALAAGGVLAWVMYGWM